MKLSSGNSPARGAVGWTLVLSVLILAPVALVGMNPFDEGFIATGAMMILKGWLPMKDFFNIYGPGQYYLSAALLAVFGEDLFVLRVAHVVLLALIGGGLAWFATRLLPGARWAGHWVGLAYVSLFACLMPNAGYPALLATLTLMLAAHSMARGLADVDDRTPFLWASVWLGLTGLVRWDFAVLGLVALGLPFLVSPARNRGRHWLVSLLPLLLLMAVGFAPFVLLGDARRWVEEIPLFHLHEFPMWRSRDAVMPAWWSFSKALQARDASALQHAVQLVAFMAPLGLAVLGGAVAAFRLYVRRDGREGHHLALLMALLTLVLLNQVRVRAGLPQCLPALAVSLPLAPYVVAALAGRGVWRALVRPVAIACAAGLALPAAMVWKQALLDSEPMDMPRASHLRILSSDAQAWRHYRDLVVTVRACTPEGAPIFSGVADTSRLFVNDAMLYFLADRPSPTRWFEMEPGLTGAAKGQEEVVQELSRARVAHAVLWNVISNEPNATATSTGIHILDRAIAERYPRTSTFGPYTLRSEAGAAGDACHAGAR